MVARRMRRLWLLESRRVRKANKTIVANSTMSRSVTA
jgi:hypothetical protein